MWSEVKRESLPEPKCWETTGYSSAEGRQRLLFWYEGNTSTRSTRDTTRDMLWRMGRGPLVAKYRYIYKETFTHGSCTRCFLTRHTSNALVPEDSVHTPPHTALLSLHFIHLGFYDTLGSKSVLSAQELLFMTRGFFSRVHTLGCTLLFNLQFPETWCFRKAHFLIKNSIWPPLSNMVPNTL